MDNLKIEGKTIYLRKVKLSDAESDYYKWINDPQVTEFLESRFENWTKEKLKNYIKQINKNSQYLFLAIIVKNNEKHIGNIKLGPINRHHKFADIGIMIGDKKYWGKGIATETIKLLTNYAFNKLNLHKITASVYSNNKASIKAFKKAGYLIEGIRKKQYFFNGIYVDGVLLGKLN